MTISLAALYLESIAQRIEYIESLPFAERLKAIKLACYLRTQDPQLRDKAVTACLDGGLLTSPIDTFSADVQRIITEVLDAQ